MKVVGAHEVLKGDLMLYEELQLELLKLLQRRGAWERVVAFDIETSARGRFFSGERVLSVSLARRSSGKPREDEGIEGTLSSPSTSPCSEGQRS